MEKKEGWDNWYKHQEGIIHWLNMEALSDAYGWTPEQIENIDIETKRAYEAILRGKGQKSPN